MSVTRPAARTAAGEQAARFHETYAFSLRRYMTSPSESLLRHAYELGRGGDPERPGRARPRRRSPRRTAGPLSPPGGRHRVGDRCGRGVLPRGVVCLRDGAAGLPRVAGDRTPGTSAGGDPPSALGVPRRRVACPGRGRFRARDAAARRRAGTRAARGRVLRGQPRDRRQRGAVLARAGPAPEAAWPEMQPWSGLVLAADRECSGAAHGCARSR